MALQSGGVMVLALLMVAAAAPSSQENKHGEFEERVRNLEKAWNRVDLQLQQGTGKLDLIHDKLDRLERLMSTRVDNAGQKLETHAHQIQIAADRATSACNRLHQRLHTTNLNVQPAGTQATRTGREATKVNNGPRDTVQGFDFHKAATDHRYPNNQIDKRPTVMQQDSTATLSKEASTITAKISYMYNELWRRSMMLEGLAKDTMALTNATRRETQDGLRSLMMQLTRKGLLAAPTPASHLQQCNVTMESLSNMVQRKLADANQKMDMKFRDVMLKQDLFLDSYHRTQLEEPELTNEITKVLDKMLDSFIKKITETFDELQKIQESIKAHDSHIAKAVARVNNAALMSVKENKNLIEAVATVSNDCQRVDSIRHHQESNRKLDTMITFLQELREQLTYSEDQTDDVKYFDTEVVLEGIKSELQNIFSNRTPLLESMSALSKNKTNEMNGIIEKLSHLVEKLHHSIVQFDEKDDYFESEDLDNEETEVKLRHSGLVNITTPKELIDKLNQITFEPSEENTSLEETEKRSFHGSKFKEKRTLNVEYNTEGPKAKMFDSQNRRHEWAKHKNRNYQDTEADTPDLSDFL